MVKLYTENQYKEYLDFMDKIANEDDIMKGFSITRELHSWIDFHNLTEECVLQMDERMEEEFYKSM